MRIILNAVTANKNAGGAFQVSLNFIKYTIQDTEIEWYYWLSESLYNALDLDIMNEKLYVFKDQPDLMDSYWKTQKKLSYLEKAIDPDLIYTITAPSYFRFKFLEVMRYTNPWVANPNKYAWRHLSITDKLKKRIYIYLHYWLLNKCRFFITQSETTKKGIQKVAKTSSDYICVVPNVLPAYYETISPIQKIEHDGNIYISCVSVPYPHKNIDIIPDVLYYLKRDFGINNVYFHITIQEHTAFYAKFNARLHKLGIEEKVINWGYCNQKRLVELYSKSDICFMPTLLEVFTASLLEGMYFGLPVITSDLPFNKDVIKDAALYFKPCDARDAAEKIAKVIQDKQLQIYMKERDKEILTCYSGYGNHYRKTIEAFRYFLNIKSK